MPQKKTPELMMDRISSGVFCFYRRLLAGVGGAAGPQQCLAHLPDRQQQSQRDELRADGHRPSGRRNFAGVIGRFGNRLWSLRDKGRGGRRGGSLEGGQRFVSMLQEIVSITSGPTRLR